MKTILVTGADGYIGRGVVKRLLEEDYRVEARGFSPLEINHPNLYYKQGDIFNEELSFANSAVPDVLLHLAWRDGFNHYADSHINDLASHYAFIRRVIDAGVKQVAIMGSMHEVGFHEGAITETTPCNPTTPYGIAKNALRQLTEDYCRRTGVVFQWLRGFYLVDNTGNGASIFSKLVDAEKRGDETFPFTSGLSKYDFLPYDAFCNQVVAVITQNAISGIINICSGTPIALGEYMETFIRDNDFTIKLSYGAYPDRPYDSPAIWGDDSKIRMIMEQDN